MAAHCGGGGGKGSGNAGGGGGTNTGTAGADGIGGDGPNNPLDGFGGDIIGDGGNCTPTTCEAQGKTCGLTADGCGSVIDCGGCADGKVCGLLEANQCAGVEDVCVRVSQEVACADKQCGVEGDGCGGTYDCGSCPTGQLCGLVEAYQCATPPSSSSTDCPARITSCASVGASCGVIGNGCGGTIDCGGCGTGELCGNDPTKPLQCAPFDACVGLSPEAACAGKCGVVGDGCGGTVDCEAENQGCTGDDTCGGGGVAFQCGQGDDYSCEPDENACQGRECGFVSDGCGAAIDCGAGAGCGGGEQCSNGQCVAIQPGCTALTKEAACAGKECGTVGDNCGGTYQCGANNGACTAPEQCGVISAYQCDISPNDSENCVARTREEACAGKECGEAFDGCGTTGNHVYDCGPLANGACPGGTFCGVQEAYQCDPLPTQPACVPNGQNCTNQGWACGTFVDNCGNTSSCGTCIESQTCMGGITGPTTCVAVAGGAGSSCPLCSSVPTSCASNQLTRLTGRVITPGQDDSKTANHVRVPNAFVYIVRADDTSVLPAIGTGLPGSDGLSCDRCADQDLGPVLVGDVTDSEGKWELEGNIPVNKQFLLVTKVGKFRRAQRITLPPSAACVTTALPETMSTAGGELAGQGTGDNPTRLPRSMSDGLAVNIPRMAITTGAIDAMECVFYKMGLAQAEFGNYGDLPSHRIDLYRGASSGSPQGAFINGSTPHDSNLYNSLSRLEEYDMVVSDCEGGGWDSSFNQRGDGSNASQGGKVRQYVNRGGRMFLSHLSFSWLHQNGTTAYNSATALATGLGQAGTWSTSAISGVDFGTGVISNVGTRPRKSPRIQTFADWMSFEGVASAPDYSFRIIEPRSQNTAINAGTEEFVYRNDTAAIALEPDYSSTGNNRVQQFSFNTPFNAPSSAACGRVAYSGFHVAAAGGQGNSPFTSQTFPNHCTSATLGNSGNLTPQEKILLFMLFDLGTCVGQEPEPPSCTELTCQANQCGVVPDGCGGTMDCAGCPSGQQCNANVCTTTCVKTTCEAQGVACSTIADGCGGVIECECNACVPQTQQTVCAGGRCGYHSDGCNDVVFCGQCPQSCVPATVCPAGACGTIGDGCNGTINCPTCPGGQFCGAGGPNTCGEPACVPLECYELDGVECGLVGDGCGGTMTCGSCGPGQICTVVNGQPNRCAGCVAKTKTQACAGLECGLVGDGCGGTHDCGTCSPGEYCGALSPNMCDPGPQCTPQACPSGAECGVIGDGCGGSINCGTCPPDQLCGVFEPYKCGGCTPQSCESAGAQCGKIGDGCGGELDCGECPARFTCGLGQPNKCGQLR